MASIPEQRVCKQVRDRQLYNMQSSIQIATTRIPALSFLQVRCPSCRSINRGCSMRLKIQMLLNKCNLFHMQ